MAEFDLEAIRARDAMFAHVPVERLVTQSMVDRRALLAAYDALRSRLAEVEAEHAAFSNNVEQCEAENDALRSRLAEESRRHMEQTAELVRLTEDRRVRLAEAEALLREESYELYRFTQMTMDRRRRIDAFLLSDSATHRESARADSRNYGGGVK